MAPRTKPQDEPESPPDGPQSPPKLRIDFYPQSVMNVTASGIEASSGITADIFLPSSGQRGVRKPDLTLRGDSAAAVMSMFASWADGQTFGQLLGVVKDNAGQFSA